MLRFPGSPQNAHLPTGFDMTDTDQEKEDAVLKRMLKTPPKKNEPIKKEREDGKGKRKRV